MSPRRFFTIIEDSGVTEVVATESKTDPRVDDVFEALKWRLAREPNVGTGVQHNGIDYKLVFFNPVKGAKNPYVLAKYLVDEEKEEILIEWVKVYPYDAKIAHSNPAFDIDG
jgi:hypothetical protein